MTTKVTVVQGDLTRQAADTLIVNLFEGTAEPGGATAALDRALDGAIRDLMAAGDLTGKSNTMAVFYPRGALAARRVLVVGLGPAAGFTPEKARLAAATAIQKARDLGARRVATIAHGAGAGGLEAALAAQATVEGLLLGLYQFEGRPAGAPGIESVAVVEFDGERLAAVEAGAHAGQITAESANFARDLVNQPPNVCTPEYLAERARQMAAEVGLGFQALGPDEMEVLGMGALLAVAQASVLPPRLIILEHQPAGAAERAPVVLVGKGVTFDSGGLSIKGAGDMPSMKADMGGAAAVIGALRAAALLNVPVPVIGLAPASENVIGSAGYRPADVLRASNGKTIEIISTDAEGRLLLADALVYAARYQPAAVIDLATLTGACAIALGRGMAAGLFDTDAALGDRVRRAAERTGERVWPLPLYPEYRDGLKSDVADMKNSAGDRYGGVGVSAAFLKEFAEGYPWAHLDIAPMAYLDGPKAPWPRGATGYGVRLLAELLRAWA